jgi:tetratricopeptide (TPR) repeat protein
MTPHPKKHFGVHLSLWQALHHAIRTEDNDQIEVNVLKILPGLYRPTDGDGSNHKPYKVPAASPLGALLGTVLPPITTYDELAIEGSKMGNLQDAFRDRLSALYPGITDSYLGQLIRECSAIEYRAESLLPRLWNPAAPRRLPATQFLCHLGRMRAAESFAGTQGTSPDPRAAVVVAEGWRHLHDRGRSIDITSSLIRKSENLPAALATRAETLADLGEFRKAHADASRAWKLQQNAYIAFTLMRTAEAVNDEKANESALAYLRLPTTNFPNDITI